MVITEHVIAEFRVLELILCHIQADITTRQLILSKFVTFKMKAWRIRQAFIDWISIKVPESLILPNLSRYQLKIPNSA